MAVDAGARLSTHLGNGAHRILPRHPNYIWDQLAEDRLCLDHADIVALGEFEERAEFGLVEKPRGLEEAKVRPRIGIDAKACVIHPVRDDVDGRVRPVGALRLGVFRRRCLPRQTDRPPGNSGGLPEASQ